MKQLSAILFLSVLVFNFFGYRLVISYMEKSDDLVMEQKLNKADYNDDELISIKTTLNLPYYSSSATYERVHGSVNIDGIVYEYVKKRVYKDTLELLCLPNTAKTTLHGIKNELTKSTADGQASVPVKKSSTTLKVSLPDFFQQLETASSPSVTVQTNFRLQNEAIFFFDFNERQERPPQCSPFIS